MAGNDNSKRKPAKGARPVLPADLPALVELLAEASAQQQGLAGEAAREHIDELKDRVDAVRAATETKRADHERRDEAATAVEALIDSFAKLDNDLGKQVAKHGKELKGAFRGAELAKMGDALQRLADYLRDPSEQKQKAIEQVIEELRALTGAPPMWDRAAEDAKRKAELEQSVRDSLEEIFGKD